MAFHPFLLSFREIAHYYADELCYKFIGLGSGMREPNKNPASYADLLLIK